MTELEQDLRLMLGRTPEGRVSVETAFHERLGEQAPARLARARAALAYLRQHSDELREHGMVAFGERAGDVTLDPRLAEALTKALAG